MAGAPCVIAYLAPELTAVESTYVYDELLALERRGVRVVPISVHRPSRLLIGHDDLLARTHYLYEGGTLRILTNSFLSLARARINVAAGLRWLIKDLCSVGPMGRNALKLIYQFIVALRVAAILRRFDCAHLHIHFAHVPAQIGMYAAAMAAIPFTVMAHANDIFERGLLLPRKAERALRLITISEHNRDHLERMGVAPEKLAVLRCGVSFPPRSRRPTFRQRDTFRIGTLGRLVEKKGIDVLIRAVPLLRETNTRIVVSIAGDGPLRGDLEALVAALALERTVVFEGNMAHDEVREWMQDLDAFVLACKRDANGDMDGIPVVLMEAMSQLVPVISTRLSGIPELVIDEQTGLLAKPNDECALAVCIDRLRDAPELRRALAERAEAHVRTEFGQELNVNRLFRHMGMP